MKGFFKTIALSLVLAGTITVSAENLLKDTKVSTEGGWIFWLNKPALDAGGSCVLQDGKATVKSPSLEKQNAWDIQVVKPVDVDAGKKYKLTFKAKSEKAGKLIVSYGLNKPPYTDYAGATVALEPGEKAYECTLAVAKAKDGNYDSPRALRFAIGDFKDATVTLSDVSLEEVK